MRISLMFCLPICLATYGQVSNRTLYMWLAMIYFLNFVLLQFIDNFRFGIESDFRYDIDLNTASLSVCYSTFVLVGH